MSKIKATFKTDGSTEVEGVGFKGKGCAEATRFLREALGESVEESRKAEFFTEDEKEVHKVVSQDSGE